MHPSSAEIFGLLAQEATRAPGRTLARHLELALPPIEKLDEWLAPEERADTLLSPTPRVYASLVYGTKKLLTQTGKPSCPLRFTERAGKWQCNALPDFSSELLESAVRIKLGPDSVQVVFA